jgi:hypothetical protein
VSMREWESERGREWVREWVSVCEWGSEWVIEWESECVSEWVSEWAREWVRERASEWVSEWASEWVSEWVSERVSEWVSEWASEWVSERVSIKRIIHFNKCIPSIPHVLWLFMPLAHSVRTTTLGDYSFHIRRPLRVFAQYSGSSFIARVEKYLAFWMSYILHSLLAAVFIGWSQTYTQFLHARTQSISRN